MDDIVNVGLIDNLLQSIQPKYNIQNYSWFKMVSSRNRNLQFVGFTRSGFKFSLKGLSFYGVFPIMLFFHKLYSMALFEANNFLISG